MAYGVGVFLWQERAGPVQWGFTRREGGSSAPPFDSLNLGGHVGDDPDAVERNRSALAGALGVPRSRLLFLSQCHGQDVVVADGPWPSGQAPVADGVVTTAPDLAVAVLVADCTPVLLADAGAGVVGAVHAGRPGMLGGVVPAAVAAMREQGAGDLVAVVGPSVCGRCYEVPADLREQAARVRPEAATVSWTGTPAVDVAAGVVAQLHDEGVVVRWVAGCTRESPSLYSYRRDGRTGRFAGVVRLVGGRGGS